MDSLGSSELLGQTVPFLITSNPSYSPLLEQKALNYFSSSHCPLMLQSLNSYCLLTKPLICQLSTSTALKLLLDTDD